MTNEELVQKLEELQEKYDNLEHKYLKLREWSNDNHCNICYQMLDLANFDKVQNLVKESK